MKITYRIYSDWSLDQRQILSSFNIFPSKAYDSIDIEETDANKRLLQFIDEWQLEKFVGTTFSKMDIQNCSTLMYVGAWDNGYPQPENIHGYMAATYDLRNYCDECGIGAIQNAPFRLKKEPDWGHRFVFELGWVFDEIFARKEFYEKVLKPEFDLDCREVVHHKRNVVIENTVQLILPISKTPLEMNDTAYTLCIQCHRKRYTPQVKGFLPKFVEKSDASIIKCSEYFGSGGGANNRLFISKSFYNRFKEWNIKLTAWPVAF